MTILIGKSGALKNPSLLHQNRFKCLRRVFYCPRQKQALYVALNESLKFFEFYLL